MALKIKAVFVFLLLITPFAFISGGDFVFDIEGQAWSSNIGWIDFSPAIGGVQVDLSGDVTGYAWSSNIGWIKFDNLDNYPSEPHHSVKVDVSGDLEGCEKGNFCGWARALAGEDEDDGWDGWIHFGSDSSNYQITIEESSGDRDYQLMGVGWGSNVIGWTSFNCQNTNICDSTSYRVETDFHPYQPEVEIDSVESGDYCNEAYPVEEVLLDYDSQYDIEPDTFDIEIIYLDNNYTVFEDDNLPYPEDGRYRLPAEELDFDTDYEITVRVTDEEGVSSDPSSKEFSTEIRYPEVDFSWQPSEPIQDELVEFEDDTTYWDWEDVDNRQGDILIKWSFPSTAQKMHKEGSPVSNEFSEEGSFEVTMEVEANILGDGEYERRSCSRTHTINTETEIPEWEETDPFN